MFEKEIHGSVPRHHSVPRPASGAMCVARVYRHRACARAQRSARAASGAQRAARGMRAARARAINVSRHVLLRF